MSIPPFGSPPTPDASSSKKGKVQLAGDLGGTAASPTVAKIGGVATGGDPLTQYALLAGRSGGQTLDGGSASGNNLTLNSTSNATKGKILLGSNSAYDEANTRLGIGTISPSYALHEEITDTTAYGVFVGQNYAYFHATLNPGSAFGGAGVAVNGLIETASGNVQNFTGNQFTGVTGSVLQANHNGTGTVNALVGVQTQVINKAGGTVTTQNGGAFNAQNASTGNVTTLHGGHFIAQNTGTGTTTTAVAGYFLPIRGAGNVTTMYGLQVDTLSNAGTGAIGTTYGIWVGSMTVGTQTNHSYSLYLSDTTAYNYLGGPTGINNTLPQAKLDISGTIATAAVGTERELILSRQVNGGNSFPQVASFALGSYALNGAGNGFGPSTRLDIQLKSTAATDENTDQTVMTLQANQQVGINNSAPGYTLDVGGDIASTTVGKGFRVKEGTNAKMGTATLASGTVTVSTTAVTASSRIFLTVQSLGTITTPTAVAVTARTAGTSFTITSASATDTSVVAWMIVEPS